MGKVYKTTVTLIRATVVCYFAMSETRIEADVIYQHEKYGDVLVTGIAKMYSEWDVTGPTDDINSGQTLVFFYDNYDGYGGMNPTPLSQPVAEFGKAVTRESVHEYVDTSELQMEEEDD